MLSQFNIKVNESKRRMMDCRLLKKRRRSRIGFSFCFSLCSARFLGFFFFIFIQNFFLVLHGIIYLDSPADFHPKMEVAACFLEYQDKILLLHRQDSTSQGNLWGIPGGKLVKGESPLDAVIREVLEETGFDISKQSIIDLGKVYIKYPTVDYIYHMFKCQPIEHPSKVKIQFNEHKGFTWVTPDDALKMHLMLDEDACIKLIYQKYSEPSLTENAS